MSSSVPNFTEAGAPSNLMGGRLEFENAAHAAAQSNGSEPPREPLDGFPPRATIPALQCEGASGCSPQNESTIARAWRGAPFLESVMEIGLVLGAGGARGFAHIGAIRALHENHYEPISIVGASMGGIIGAMVAAGHSCDEIMDIAADRSRLRLPARGRYGGLISQDRIIDAFCQHLPESIEDLKVPFAAVAVDITSGELVLLESGHLRSALAATVAIPGVLSPVKRNGRYLVDGGAINALPVDVIRQRTGAKIVAVDVTPPRDRPLALGIKEAIWKRLWSYLTFRSRLLTVDVFLKASVIQQSLMNEQRLEKFPPDLYIRPKLDRNFRMEEFLRWREAADVGYESARAALREATL